MKERVITIESDGTIRFLVDDFTEKLLEGKASVRRASHVEPDNKAARVIFHGLRSLFGEKGIMAEFTRMWPCKWRVNLNPVDGPILAERWRDRQEAIDAEVEWLNANFL